MSLKSRVLFLAAGVLLAAACGASDDDQSDSVAASDMTELLDGREFWSVSVIQDDADRILVDGTRISLRFSQDQVSASAGCNSMGGRYQIDSGGVLVVTELAMTEIGCDPERHAQDDFVASVLTGSPVVSLSGDDLALTTPSAQITLLDRTVADPDRPIVGTEWEATGFIQGEAAISMAIDVPGSIVFPDQSTMTGFDGCETFTRPVEVSDGSTGGPVEGDGEIQFGPRESGVAASSDCEDVRDYVDAFDRLFATDDATFTIDGPNLTMLNGQGDGVTFRAADQ